MARRKPVLTAPAPTRQIGIRQRSLVGRCRLGRATELVFILATGTALVLSSGAVAQVVWEGGTDNDWTEGTNWDGTATPEDTETAQIGAPLAGPPFGAPFAGGDDPIILGVDEVIVDQTNIIADGFLTVEGTLISPVTLTDNGSLSITADGEVQGTVDASDDSNVTNAGEIDGNLTLNDDATYQGAGTITGTLDVNGGTATIDDGGTVGGVTTITDGGTVNSEGTLAGVTVTEGELNLSGDGTAEAVGVGADGTLTLVDDSSVASVTSAGTVTVGDGTSITGTLDVNGGTTTIDDGGTVGGATTITDGGIVNSEGTLAGVTVTEGELNLSGDGTAEAVGVGADGTLSLVDDSSVASVTSAGTVTVGDGTSITGTLEVTGGTTTIDDGGEVEDLTTIDGGTVDNSGTLAAVDNQVGGTFNNLVGGEAGAVTNAGTGLNAGEIASLENLAGGVFTTTGTITGDLENFGTVEASGVISGDVDNDATMNVTGNLGDIATFTNNGTLDLSDGTTTTATSFLNYGDIIAQGPVTLEGDLENFADSTISIDTGTVGETFTVNGNVSGTTTLALNADISTVDMGSSDRFVVNGTITGSIEANFNATGASPQDGPIIFIEGTGVNDPALTVTTSGLDAGGLLEVLLIREADNIGFQLLPNTSLGGVAGTLGSIQGLIGTVVNRPSSPFVSRVLFEPEDGCSPGGWARGIAGTATSDTSTLFGASGVSVPSTSRLRYRGIQAGFDFSCIDDGPGGLEYSFGVTFGQNTGTTRQNRFALGGDGTPDLDNPLEPITGSFTQRYGAVYSVFGQDDWAGDLQLRREHTSVTFNNEALGLDDSEISTTGTTFSGSLTYFFSLDDGLTLAPTAGFSITRTGAGELLFGDDPDDPTATLFADSHTSRVGFVGATIARNFVNEEAQSATTAFATATFYNDFAGARSTRFGLSGGGTTDLSTDNLGAFGEVSLGMNYVRLMNGGAGAPRQFTATIRGDARFSNRLESYGLTAQVRVNF